MVATDSTYQTSVLSEINLELLYLSCLKCFLQKALLTIKVSSHKTLKNLSLMLYFIQKLSQARRQNINIYFFFCLFLQYLIILLKCHATKDCGVLGLIIFC